MRQTISGWRLLTGFLAAGVVAAAAGAGFFGTVAAAEPIPPPTPGQTSATTTPPAMPAAAAPTVLPGSSGTAPTAPTRVPASSGTLRDFFAQHDVQLEPQQAAGFTPLDITLPVPTGWTLVPDPNVPDAFAVIADRGSPALYTPNAAVVVYRLVGHFDPGEAITHGYIDSQQLPAWRTTNASLADFGGFPSSLIEGTYRQNDMTLNTSRRHVIATSGVNNYLVTATVTTGIGESIGNAPATDAIINGFRVSAPGAAAQGLPSHTASPQPSRPALPARPRG